MVPSPPGSPLSVYFLRCFFLFLPSGWPPRWTWTTTRRRRRQRGSRQCRPSSSTAHGAVGSRATSPFPSHTHRPLPAELASDGSDLHLRSCPGHARLEDFSIASEIGLTSLSCAHPRSPCQGSSPCLYLPIPIPTPIPISTHPYAYICTSTYTHTYTQPGSEVSKYFCLRQGTRRAGQPLTSPSWPLDIPYFGPPWPPSNSRGRPQATSFWDGGGGWGIHPHRPIHPRTQTHTHTHTHPYPYPMPKPLPHTPRHTQPTRPHHTIPY